MALNSCLAMYKWYDVQNFTSSCKHLGLMIVIHFVEKKADLISGKTQKNPFSTAQSVKWCKQIKAVLYFSVRGDVLPTQIELMPWKSSEEEGCLIVWRHLWISRHVWQRTALLPTDRSCSRVLILVMVCVCVEWQQWRLVTLKHAS